MSEYYTAPLAGMNVHFVFTGIMSGIERDVAEEKVRFLGGRVCPALQPHMGKGYLVKGDVLEEGATLRVSRKQRKEEEEL